MMTSRAVTSRPCTVSPHFSLPLTFHTKLHPPAQVFSLLSLFPSLTPATCYCNLLLHTPSTTFHYSKRFSTLPRLVQRPGFP